MMLASVLLAVGCGTTVQLPANSQSAVASGDSGLGLSVPQQATPVDTAPPSTGLPTGSTSTHGVKPTSSLPTQVASSIAPTKTHQASNHTPIEIGFVTTSVGNAQSLGVNAGQSYSDKAMWSALVAEYNKRGGVDGHRIVPVYGTTDTASSNWASQFQAVCAKFTQDHHVQAVIGYVFVFLPSFESCLANKGVPHLYGGYQPGDVVDQQQYPTLVSTSNPATDGALITALDGGLRSGILNRSTK